MAKPEFVFHGSCKGIGSSLEPRLQHGDINGAFPEGGKKLVFATHVQDLAAIYTLKNENMLSAGECEGKNFAIFRDYNSWKKDIDASACNVYVLPSDTFSNTLRKIDGTPTIEWQSSASVTPHKIIHYTPEDVMRTGSQLFFLDPKIGKEIWHYDPKGSDDFSFMNRIVAKHNSGALPPEFTIMHLAKELMDAGIMKHLNKNTGINPIPLDNSPYAGVIKEDIEWLKQKILSKDDKQKIWTESLGNRTGFSREKK